MLENMNECENEVISFFEHNLDSLVDFHSLRPIRRFSPL